VATARRRYLQDLVIGETAESRPHAVLLADMLDFARRYDPQYFHADPDAAKASIFGQVIASGIYSAAIWRRLDHEISGDIAWICGIAWKQAVWPTPMRAGDVVRARAECLSKRRSRSDPMRGVVETRYTLVNARDEVVFGCLSINLVEADPLVP
jgi:acyl dehydratase